MLFNANLYDQVQAANGLKCRWLKYVASIFKQYQVWFNYIEKYWYLVKYGCMFNTAEGCLGDNERAARAVVLPAPEGAGRMMQSKPERSEGFDVIIRPTPEVAGRTTPEQTGHCSHFNTKLTDFAISSRKFALHSSHWIAVAAILFLQIQWALSPPLYSNKSNRTYCTKWGA